jgi:hypothetical protein
MHLSNVEAWVMCIGMRSICKNSYVDGAFLDRREGSQVNGVVLQHEVRVELPHAMKDLHEQFLAHPIEAPKIVG